MDAREETNMKEVLTKSFWQGVKKTFYEALEDPPPDTTDSPQPPAENVFRFMEEWEHRAKDFEG